MTPQRGKRRNGAARYLGCVATSLSTGLLFASSPAAANHSWGGYHWARTANPFTVTIGSNITAAWLSYAQSAVGTLNMSNSAGGYWSIPSYSAGGLTAVNPVRTRLVSGSASARTCKPQSGTVQLCNAKYGYTGWLGVAQIWTSGLHITQGTVKFNDSYYSLATYNSPDWRAIVACQEIGHTFGLDHQDEDQNNADLADANGTQTCMDYTSNPQGNGQPNFHDYKELGTIYSHVDATTTLASSTAAAFAADAGNGPPEWGKAVAFAHDGRGRVFEKVVAPGKRITTFVFWKPGR